MKRPTIKGKGWEIFFPESRLHTSSTLQQRAGKTSHQNARTTPRRPYGKVTFWLPEELIERLDSYWVEQRAKDRKRTKSGIAAEALEEFLQRKGRVS